MIKHDEVFKIGKIGKPHGVKGEVSFLFDDDVFDRVNCDYLVLEINGILVPFFFEEYRFKSDSTALVTFCDIETKEQAQEITGCNVFFPRRLSDNDYDEASWHSLVGFTILDAEADDKPIGIITDVDNSTVNALFCVKTNEGRNILIPAVDEFVLDVDVEHSIIRLRMPSGLLELDS